MAKVEFEIADNLMAHGGIAVLNCVNANGDPIIYTVPYGPTHMVERIGLLTFALDQCRHDLVDRGPAPNDGEEVSDA